MENSENLVDQLEMAFQACISTINSQEHLNAGSPDEVKACMEQHISKFTAVGRQLDQFFIEKRQLLAYHKPDEGIKDDVAELKQELQRKEALLTKHNERVQLWHSWLNKQQPYPGQQLATGGPGAASHSQQSGAAGSTQQGPLAYLEQTTSNIGTDSRKG